MEILGPCPITPCFIRNQFLYNQRKGHGDFTEGYIFAVRAVQGRAICFQVQLVNGAQWANVPIHMLVERRASPLPINVAAWWDCFSDHFTVCELPLLHRVSVDCRGRDGVTRTGRYLFTVDWKGHWADIADQHKQHHIIALHEGQLVAYPNNKCTWKDESWFSEKLQRTDYRTNSHVFRAEGHGRDDDASRPSSAS